ncbi:MAG TPA: J domain-containing protein [Vicinamibacterales bacterium]|nr:J domain-containing protein [Vicinamibacterales bacterium]
MDLYGVLGLKPGAGPAEIKRAYRRLARRYHPDINPGDPAAAAFFRRVTEAYETLLDPERRRLYESGQAPSAAGERAGGFAFEGFDFSGAPAEGPRAATFSEFFADVFQRPAARAQPERGADVHTALRLGFEEAVRGAERPVTITHREACALCQGTGVLHAAGGPCPRCRGAGHVRLTRGHMIFSRACPTCGGSGERREQPCAACSGEGATMRTETLTVRIPAGVTDGARVRVAGKGHAGRHGGPPGDLLIAIEVEPHPLYRREGADLFLTVPIAVHEAALGAKIDVPTLEGPARLRIPPGTQSGQRFRLRGRGAPSTRDGRRGDLVVEVRIVVPLLRDERSRELMREFARLNADNVRKDLPWQPSAPPAAARPTT